MNGDQLRVCLERKAPRHGWTTRNLIAGAEFHQQSFEGPQLFLRREHTEKFTALHFLQGHVSPACAALANTIASLGTLRRLRRCDETVHKFFEHALYAQQNFKSYNDTQETLLHFEASVMLLYCSQIMSPSFFDGLLAETVQLALRLRLDNRNAIQNSFPDIEDRRRAQKAFWLLYIIEKPHSMRAGVSSMLNDTLIDHSPQGSWLLQTPVGDNDISCKEIVPLFEYAMLCSNIMPRLYESGQSTLQSKSRTMILYSKSVAWRDKCLAMIQQQRLAVQVVDGSSTASDSENSVLVRYYELVLVLQSRWHTPNWRADERDAEPGNKLTEAVLGAVHDVEQCVGISPGECRGALAKCLAINLLVQRRRSQQSFVPVEVRASSLIYVHIGAFSAFSSAVETAVAAAGRALDKPDVPLVISAVKFLVNIALDLLLHSPFHVSTTQPSVNMQASNQLACGFAAATAGVCHLLWTQSWPSVRRERFRCVAPSWRSLLVLTRPGLLTLTESLVRNALYIWLVSNVVGLGATYATAWGVFNTIRWGLVMVPVQALEATALAFTGYAWGQWRQRIGVQQRRPRVSRADLMRIVRPALMSLALALTVEVLLAIFLSLFGTRPSALYLTGLADVADVTAYMWRSIDWCYDFYAVSTQLAAILLATRPKWYLYQSLVSNLVYVLPWAAVKSI
ncbi:putative Polysaccharide biosynthesis protein C-terminal domain-containing protein [Seiridium cardinale]|uniref:Polysaccharide biosynthesis protein C-terminal domain-containing protein n=1 Tax=Seiridium cardinale TaxID=138064 RepID=A0ABR2XM50_9PEZI